MVEKIRLLMKEYDSKFFVKKRKIFGLNECRIEHYSQYGEDCVGCSVCGYVTDRYIFEETNSCPNCGRKVVW